MVHCGYEPSAAYGINSKFSDPFKSLSWLLSYGEADSGYGRDRVSSAGTSRASFWIAGIGCVHWLRDPARIRELEGTESYGAICGIRIRWRGRSRDAAWCFTSPRITGCGHAIRKKCSGRMWRGRRNLLNAAQGAGVERVVYTSTVGCIGIPKDGIGDEQTPVAVEEMTGPYKRSKFRSGAGGAWIRGDGFPVVIVNPTAPVGDHDFKPTPTGKMVVDFVRGAMPGFVDTGLNVVDVRDVAQGHLLALRTGTKRGTVYSGVGEPDAGADFRETGAGLPASPRRSIRVPYAVAYRGGRGVDGLGGNYGKRAARAARRGADGAEEDVGAA